MPKIRTAADDIREQFGYSRINSNTASGHSIISLSVDARDIDVLELIGLRVYFGI